MQFKMPTKDGSVVVTLDGLWDQACYKLGHELIKPEDNEKLGRALVKIEDLILPDHDYTLLDLNWVAFVWSEHINMQGGGKLYDDMVGWLPITVQDLKVIDGVLRVLCAQILGIKQIRVEPIYA